MHVQLGQEMLINIGSHLGATMNRMFQFIDNGKCRLQSLEIGAVIESDVASSDVNQRYATTASDRLECIVAQFEIESLQASVRGTKQQSS